MKALVSELRPAISATLVLAAVTCGAYPLAVTSIAQILFKDQASGSLVRDEKGTVLGSRLLGQAFTSEKYFHPRPSAAGNGYDPTSSGGSNLGPTSQKLRDQIRERVAAYRSENRLADGMSVPANAVTASGSGLDPHISVRNARLQTARVAAARQISEDRIVDLIATVTDRPSFGMLGEAGVNVLLLNHRLDALK